MMAKTAQAALMAAAVASGDAAKLVTHGRLAAHQIAPLVRSITPISPVELFDHLRQGLAVGPLPPAIPPAYLETMQASSVGLEVG